MRMFWLHFLGAALPGLTMMLFAIVMCPPRWMTWRYWFPRSLTDEEKQLLAILTRRAIPPRLYR